MVRVWWRSRSAGGSVGVDGVDMLPTPAMRETVFEYIEVEYNRTRRHSANGYISPQAFEAKKAA
jgi:putative transposase